MSIRGARNIAEFLLARFALAVVPRLPRPVVLALARALGTMAYLASRHLRRVGMANLALALPHLSAVERRRMLRKSFQNFGLVMLDTFWMARDTQRRIARLVRFEQDALAALRPGAQVCVTAHLGNWEVLGMAVAQRGYRLVSVAAPIKNRRVDPLFNELRHATGQIVVPKRGAARVLLQTLRAGDKIALVLDQNIKPVDGGIFVDFFGRKAPMSGTAALLALRTGAAIMIGACLPEPGGTYRVPTTIEVDRSGLPDNQEQAVAVLTQRIADGIAALIARNPEYWLWAYKRWKIRPEGEDPARYPYYTRAIRPGDLATRGSRAG